MERFLRGRRLGMQRRNLGVGNTVFLEQLLHERVDNMHAYAPIAICLYCSKKQKRDEGLFLNEGSEQGTGGSRIGHTVTRHRFTITNFNGMRVLRQGGKEVFIGEVIANCQYKIVAA